MLEALRTDIYHYHLELPKNRLVTWTVGNVSGRDPKTGLVVIKPSGVRYETLTPESLVVVDLNGKIIEGSHKPTGDTPVHLYIYRHRPDVGGIVHTHSAFATAFAAVGRPIPCYLTSVCDEFGGEVPCGDYVATNSNETGEEIIRKIGKSPVILMKNHGVFAIGNTAADALRSAVMVEDVARTIIYALQLGQPMEISAEDAVFLRRNYLEKYNQG